MSDEPQVCAKQYHLHVWSLSSRWVAVAQAEDVATARKILLEEIGSSADGSFPIREQAAKFVAEKGPGIWHRRGAEFELTDSANLEEADAECDKLRDRIKELEAAEQRATRAARLDEAKWWHMQRGHHGQNWCCERVAALSAPAQTPSEEERT